MTEDKVAVVTGGTRGIGRAISTALGESGVHVCAGYQSNREAAESMREAAEKMGHSVTLHQMDVGEPDDCVRFVNEAIEAHGHIDYLINNAGIISTARFVGCLLTSGTESCESTSPDAST